MIDPSVDEVVLCPQPNSSLMSSNESGVDVDADVVDVADDGRMM